MPRKARSFIRSTFFHVMVQGINKESIFNNARNIETYLNIVGKHYKEEAVDIIAYCIMPNHAHFLIHSKNIKFVSMFMHKINVSYAMYYNKENNRVGYVFRDRFRMENVTDEKYLYSCINYIHNNPVKAKICDTPDKYPFSSFNEFKKRKYIINLKTINEILKDYSYSDTSESNFLQEIKFLDVGTNKKEQIDEIIKCFLENHNNINITDVLEDVDLRQKLVYELVKINEMSYNYVSKVININRKTLRKWMDQKGTGL